MPKRSKNLSLDPAAVERGERYSALHGTNVSQLVSNFLASLPFGGDDADTALSPAVRRLLGVAGKRGVRDYHQYLYEKYGR